MNDIRVKIVETPRNTAGDVPAPPEAGGTYQNEVDPLAFDDTDVVHLKNPVIVATEADEKVEGHEVKVDGCDDNAKEKIESVRDASKKVTVLNAQCEKIKQELLKDDTSSIDSSVDEISKVEDNHIERPPSSAETYMETESLPDASADLLTETAEKPDFTLETNTENPLSPKGEDNLECVKRQIDIIAKEIVIKEPSSVKEVSEIKKVNTLKQDNIPKDCVLNKETSVKKINEELAGKEFPSKEVFGREAIPLKVGVPTKERISETKAASIDEIYPAKEVIIPEKEVIKVKELTPHKDELKPKGIVAVTQVATIPKEPVKEKSPIREVITLASETLKIKDSLPNKFTERLSPSLLCNVKDSDVEMIKVPEEPQVVVKKEKVVEAAKPEVPSVNGDITKDEQPAKRRASEDAETDSPLKKLCQEVEKTFPQHDTMINEFIQTTTKHNIDEIQRHTEQLLSEIQTLRELAQKKEHEWNNILHLKKVKEEILLRLLRRKQVLSFEKSVEVQNGSSCKDPFDYLNQAKNLAIDKSDEISGLVLKQPTPPATLNNTPPMVQPPVLPTPPTTHFNPMSGLPPPYDKAAHMQSMSKPIFPQSLMMPGPTMPFPRDMNGQMTNFGMPMGRQGPIKDVKSIIADYRQRNPDVTPRRGRRMKSILNPNMMNQPRQIAPKIDNLNNLGMIFNNLDMNQKAMLERLSQMQATSLPNGMSFKDVLVQYASIQQQSAGLVPPPGPRPDLAPHSRPEAQQPRPEPAARRRDRQPQQLAQHEELHISVKQPERLAASSPRLPPPPPYPEISLLPVNSQEPGQSQQNSLLHGILTKNCGEITITPVQPTPPPPEAQPEKPEEVVQLDEDEGPRSEGSPEGSPEGAGGRLVIDEGSAAPAESSDAPLCQGCRRRDAQFVCAGCANQWYCSRDCQVAAWDDHSEMCSG